MKKTKLTILLTFLFFPFLMLILPGKASADAVSLKVSPSVIRIQAKPPADVWTPFTIENFGDQPETLKIGYKAFDPQASSNGKVVFLKDGDIIPGVDKNIFGKMQVVDDQNISHDTIDIGPKQQLHFRLRILLPGSEPTSDYYFSLIFLEAGQKGDQNNSQVNVEDQKSFSTLQAGVGLNILLAVGDKEAPQASIYTFSTPWFLDKGPVPFSLWVHNSGTHFITPHGVILIKNIFGQTVGKITIPPTTILSRTERTLASTSSLQTAKTAITTVNNANGNSSSIVWNENFLFGIYTATLNLTLSDNGPVFVRSIGFVAFPLKMLIEILIFFVVVGYIYLRVKRKIS